MYPCRSRPGTFAVFSRSGGHCLRDSVSPLYQGQAKACDDIKNSRYRKRHTRQKHPKAKSHVGGAYRTAHLGLCRRSRQRFCDYHYANPNHKPSLLNKPNRDPNANPNAQTGAVVYLATDASTTLTMSLTPTLTVTLTWIIAEVNIANVASPACQTSRNLFFVRTLKAFEVACTAQGIVMGYG